MLALRKFLLLLAACLLVFAGLWLVVVNDQPLSLNLLFFATPALSAGFLVLLAFVLGSLLGLLVGFNLLGVLRLNNRLYWLRREVRQLQSALEERRPR